MSTTSPLGFSEGRMQWIGYLRLCSNTLPSINTGLSLTFDSEEGRQNSHTDRERFIVYCHSVSQHFPNTYEGQRLDFGFKYAIFQS